MSVTANVVRAVGHDKAHNDYGYAQIMYAKTGTWDMNDAILDVMWADECVYGPPAPGSKVGDFIETWLAGPDYGVFTHRNIAEKLMKQFTGLKIKELKWNQNPYEKILKNGKPRVKKPKWLPEETPDLVYLYSDVYVDVEKSEEVKTDFFIVLRKNHTWFMCSDSALKALNKFNYNNLEIQKITISDSQSAKNTHLAEIEAEMAIPITIFIGKGYTDGKTNFFFDDLCDRFGEEFANREYYLYGFSVYDRIWYLNNRVYAIDICMESEGISRNAVLKKPSLSAYEISTLEYFKKEYKWIETKNKVHIYFPDLCLVFSCFEKKKDSKGKRIRLFSEKQRKYVEEKYLKL